MSCSKLKFGNRPCVLAPSDICACCINRTISVIAGLRVLVFETFVCIDGVKMPMGTELEINDFIKIGS